MGVSPSCVLCGMKSFLQVLLHLLAVAGLSRRNVLHEERLVHVAADGEENGHRGVQQVQAHDQTPLVSGDAVGERRA